LMTMPFAANKLHAFRSQACQNCLGSWKQILA
jgi:hypothetical protein